MLTKFDPHFVNHLLNYLLYCISHIIIYQSLIYLERMSEEINIPVNCSLSIPVKVYFGKNPWWWDLAVIPHIYHCMITRIRDWEIVILLWKSLGSIWNGFSISYVTMITHSGQAYCMVQYPLKYPSVSQGAHLSGYFHTQCWYIHVLTTWIHYLELVAPCVYTIGIHPHFIFYRLKWEKCYLMSYEDSSPTEDAKS